jgi:hypothetical protein
MRQPVDTSPDRPSAERLAQALRIVLEQAAEVRQAREQERLAAEKQAA